MFDLAARWAYPSHLEQIPDGFTVGPPADESSGYATAPDESG
ncbi:MAG: hypothetical protein ACRDGG_12235 [Anaerolineae bacterium]